MGYYMNRMKAKRRLSLPFHPPDPVLSPEDEAFLQRLIAEKQSRGGSGDGGGNIGHSVQPTCSSSREELELDKELGFEEDITGAGTSHNPEIQVQPTTTTTTTTTRLPKATRKQSWVVSRWNDLTRTKDTTTTDDNRIRSLKLADNNNNNNDDDDNVTSRLETKDMTEVLDRLNLAAVNNRAFSVSGETQQLLSKFKLILKDIVNGVPTAYGDLENLLSNPSNNRQLQRTYSKLPNFVVKLIEKLPEKWTQTFAPEIIAAASEKVGKHSGVDVENWDKAAAAAGKMGVKIPSIRELVAKPAAIIGMLRSIMAFLKARFPAVMGMNVLWSLALFILLFVLWYCHKRGREVRLQSQQTNTRSPSNGTKITNASWYENENEDGSEILKRRQSGLVSLRGAGTDGSRSRQSTILSTETTHRQHQQGFKEENTTNDHIRGSSSSAPIPQRMKTRLSLLSKVSRKPTKRIKPYPGT